MLLKALLLKALYSIRSERLLVDQVRMNLLYRWFLDLSLDAPIWSATSFTKNRERFEKHGLIRKFFDKVVAQALVEQWASDEHFTVDGTLIQSCASQKSLRPIATEDTRVSGGSEDDDSGNPTVNFRGQRRTNQTHRSLTDPEARFGAQGGGEQTRLAHGLHVLMEKYQQAQRFRKRIEETIGWCKVIGGMERCRHIGRWKNEQRALVVGLRTTCFD